MYEETGATEIEVTPVCIYKISTYGLLCYCEIKKLEKLPEEYEMSEIILSNELPKNLTFPESNQIYFQTVKDKLNLK